MHNEKNKESLVTEDVHTNEDFPLDLESVRIYQHLVAIEKNQKIWAEKILGVFADKLAYDAAKQAQVDQLHAELQHYKKNILTQFTRPLIYSMIRFHDDIGKVSAALQKKSPDELSPERFFAILKGFLEDLEIILAQNGVTAYQESSGLFNPRRQKILKKITTNKQELAGMVKESIRSGFEKGTEILEKERIEVYEFIQTPEIQAGDSVTLVSDPGTPPTENHEEKENQP